MQVNLPSKNHPVAVSALKTHQRPKSAQPETSVTPHPENRAQAITCFTSGTAITTLRGKIPVQHLQAGDKVLTRDRGFQPILWTGSLRLTPTDMPSHPGSRPILVRAGALGPDLPERDMLIASHHRVLTTDKAILSKLGTTETLIQATALIGQPGITHALPQKITFVHLALEQHEVILSENTWTEGTLEKSVQLLL